MEAPHPPLGASEGVAGRTKLNNCGRSAGARGACSMAKVKQTPSCAKDAPRVGCANKAMLVRYAAMLHSEHANARTSREAGQMTSVCTLVACVGSGQVVGRSRWVSWNCSQSFSFSLLFYYILLFFHQHPPRAFCTGSFAVFDAVRCLFDALRSDRTGLLCNKQASNRGGSPKQPVSPK